MSHAWEFYPPAKAVYNPEGLLPARGMAGSGSHPLTNIPYCCLPEESGPYLSASVGDQPLSSPTDHRLGGPLHHQLANQTHAHPVPSCDFNYQVMPLSNITKY